MNLPWRLRAPGGSTATPAAAWFVPGADVGTWLAQLAEFEVELATIRLLPLPRSRADRAACGVLALLPEGAEPRHSGRALPYAVRAGRIYLPAGAEIWPPATDEELLHEIGSDLIVWHPTIGPVGVLASEVLRCADLLRLPDVADDDWDRAVPGVAVVARLVAVAATEPQGPRGVFGSDAEDIDSKTPAERAARLIRPTTLTWPNRWFDSLLAMLERLTPLTDWVARLRQRLVARAAALVAAARPRRDDAARQREIERLMALLADDPDEGLKFALPVAGEPGRGVAPPENQLGERAVDFSLQRPSAGGPADAWQIEASSLAELQRRYRELANREIALGRHRRAAYIYSHLLGDDLSAAMVLRDGGFPREAAALFELRLHDLQAAADCLLRGGLLADAAILMERVGRHEDAGDLRLILRQPDAAHRLYAVALRTRLAREDWLGAALLQIEKLQEVDAGLALLEERFREHRQGALLAAQIAILQRLGRAAEVDRVVAATTAAPLAPVRFAAATLLARMHHRLAPAAQDQVRRRVRRVAAEFLATGPQATARGIDLPQLLAAMRRVSPRDPVLAHDTRQWLQRQPKPTTRTSSSLAVTFNLRLVPEQSHLLPGGAQWLAAACHGDQYVVAGSSNLARYCRVATWQSGSPESRPIAMQPCVHPLRSDRLQLLRPAAGQPFRVWLEPQPGDWDLLTTIDDTGTPPHGLQPGTRGLARDDDGSLWILRREARFVLVHEGPAGDLLSTEQVPALPHPLRLLADRQPMVALGGCLLLGIGPFLLRRDAQGHWTTETFESEVLCLVPSPVPGSSFVLLGFRLGFTIVDLEHATTSAPYVHHAATFDEPVLGWSSYGIVVAITEGRAQLFHSEGLELFACEEVAYPNGKPFAILPGPSTPTVMVVAAHVATLMKIVGG